MEDVKGKTMLNSRANFSGGVALTFVMLLSYLCVNLTGKLASLFLSSAMLDFKITKDFSLDFAIGATITLVLSIFLLSPLRLNIKKWYQSSVEYDLPITAAFSYFANLKKYIQSVLFCAVRFLVIFLVFLIPMIPSIILTGVVNYGFSQDFFTFNSLYGALVILSMILFALGLIFSCYFAIGYFYADFIFVKNIYANPFKALSLSRKIAKQNRNQLIMAVASVIPYYLGCIFLVTIPFLFPRIRVILAVHTNQALAEV